MDVETINAGWIVQVIDGKFPLLQWLGGSGRSGVFLTELDGPGSQRVAIKLTLANYASAQAQLVRWAEAAKLSHPHVMKLLHTGRTQVETAGVVYAVMEYAEEVLEDILKERALKPDEVKDMLVPVMDALFYLHGKGFVHGHLKPSNILVVRNHLQLSGDGLQVAGEPGRRFRALEVYDAPETGEAMMAPPADVWSLGMTMLKALTQRVPEWDRWGGKEPVIPQDIPQPFARMTRGCLKLEPAERLTLTDLNKARFEQVRSGDGPGWPAKKVTDADEDEEHRGSKRGLFAAAGVVALLTILAVVYFWPRGAKRAVQAPVTTAVEAPAAASAPATTAAPAKAPAPALPAIAAQGVGSANAPQAGSNAAAPKEETPENQTPATTESASTEQTAPSLIAAKPLAPGAGMERTASAVAKAPKEKPVAPMEQSPEAGSGAAGSGAVVHRVMPDALQSALDTIHGTVRVKIQVAVNASGNVFDATFENAGPSKYFSGLAMGAAQKWRFEPVMANGHPVASVWLLEFDFTQTGVEAAAKRVG